MKTKLLSGAFLLCLALTVQGDDWLEKYLDDPASVPGEVLALVQGELPEKLWWARFFSVEVIKHTPGEQKEG